MSYAEVYKDWKYLFDISPAYDMTGGYEDQYDLAKMLENPTKKQAEECMKNQIDYWFQVGPEDFEFKNWDRLKEDFPEVDEIREKYYIDEPNW